MNDKMNLFETEKLIKFVKDTFEKELAKNLNLIRVSAPLFVFKDSGLNDQLSGKEKAVSFTSNFIDNNKREIEIVQSLAKWKRFALSEYDFKMHSGLYTDMNAIRKDEVLDNLHSMYVDQYDWEKVIEEKDRTKSYLKKTIKQILKAIYNTQIKLLKINSSLEQVIFREDIKNFLFISTRELERNYPELSCKDREEKVCNRDNRVVFISEIGKPLKNKKPHDDRSPDYDDFTLNGDLLIYSSVLDKPVEISSMGIRVNKESLIKQLKLTNTEDRLKYPYHQAIVNNELPFTIGGGIGQSRLSLLLLNKEHIGQVQASVWDDKNIEYAKKHNIKFL